MKIRESVLEKIKWEYLTMENGTKLRFAVHENELLTQKRVVFPEHSRKRLMDKALRGEYNLSNMQVIGGGNSYLIVGWENTELFSDQAF